MEESNMYWFVDYLQAAKGHDAPEWTTISAHKMRVMQALQANIRHDVLPKFGWLVRYHNMFCYWHRYSPGYSPEYRIDRNDEESVMLRLSDLGRLS